jgi:hypothetical protein
VVEVEFGKAVHATGFGVNRSVANHSHVFTKATTIEIWKSLSLVSPRVNRRGFLFVDRLMPSFMPTQNASVINVSQLDELIAEADFALLPHQQDELSHSLRMVGIEVDQLIRNGAYFRSCLKPNVPSNALNQRTVGYETIWMSERDLIALPGKATEAPLSVFDQLTAPDVHKSRGERTFVEET